MVNQFPVSYTHLDVYKRQGINGVGKTTLAGKLARYYSLQGEEVALVAADTFRAAAVDQLEIWAERAGCFFFKGSPGADPGSIIFDGIEAARKKNRGFVIIDTAGRSHVNKNLCLLYTSRCV